MSNHKRWQRQIAAGILPICYSTKRVLLCQRGHDQSFPLQWATWGGTFEDSDKTPQDCAKREFWEETRCSCDYKISTTPININDELSTKFYLYAGVFENEWEPNIDIEQESAGYGWFGLDELPEDMMPQMDEFFSNNKGKLKKIIKYFSER